MSLSDREAAFIAFISTFLILSFLSNVSVVVVMMKIKTLRTVTNIFLSNLAISDMILASLVLPQQVHDVSHTDEYFEPEILCKLVNCLPVFSITCSIYSMVALAEERNRSLVEYGYCQLWWPRRQFVDYSVHLEPMTSQYVGNITVVTSQMVCKPKSNVFDKVNGVFILFASYMIPQAFIFTRYYRLVMFIKRQAQQTTGGLTSSFVSHNRKRIIKMLVIIAVLFSIAWLPYFVLLVGAKMTGQSSSAEGASGFVFVQLTLAVFSTSYNIVLYLVYNAEFRKSFLSIFCCVRSSTVHPSLPPGPPVTPAPSTVCQTHTTLFTR
ncbi:Pyroglutamylated RF-amide peptide receptor [Lamellibrachia satsuma]|nr:Pyroglutamylated RF-amide peptide receptor [Lamellibrachia satsuma]